MPLQLASVVVWFRFRGCWPIFGSRFRVGGRPVFGSGFCCWTGVAVAGGIGRRSLVRTPGLSGGYYAALEVCGLGSGSDGRLPLIFGGTQFGVRTSLLYMSFFCGDPGDVLLFAIR